MTVARLPRIGFLATLIAGIAMIAASLWGLAGVEADLRAAAAPVQPRPELVAHSSWDCPEPYQQRRDERPDVRDRV